MRGCKKHESASRHSNARWKPSGRHGSRVRRSQPSRDTTTLNGYNLANPERSKSPNDKKIPQTVICIIEEFFNKNPEIMLYMCSTANNQQAQRARLFLRWFNGYEQRQRYFIKAIEVRGDENCKEYIALIIQRSNPQFDEIVSRLDSEIAMFNELKP